MLKNEFSQSQLELFSEFVEARDAGEFNMVDYSGVRRWAQENDLPKLAACSRDEYFFVLKNFVSLEDAVREASRGGATRS